MAKRSEVRDEAKRVYVERRERGEKVSLRELAEELGANYKTLRDWKGKDDWDAAVKKPKRKPGGQPGNQNCKGHRNAAGHHKGAPKGNHNAEKDGAYSRVFLDMLPEDELALLAQTPTEARPALEEELKILKHRERKILSSIAAYEAAAEDALFLSCATETRGGENGTVTTEMKDSAFKRIQALQEALGRVQGRISRIADSFHAFDESEKRLALERERLEILRMRASGSVEVPGLEEDEGPVGELEDAL